MLHVHDGMGHAVTLMVMHKWQISYTFQSAQKFDIYEIAKSATSLSQPGISR
jgi:hypothetical protein